MNKKYLILTSLACLAVTGVTGVAIAAVQGGFNTLGVKAEPKSYVFDGSNTQFKDTTTPSVIERNVTTGLSDPLLTSVSLLDNGSAEASKFFSNDGYFVRNGASVTNPIFKVTIGVNNATSLRVVYGVQDSRATQIQCTFHLKDGEGEDVFAPTQLLQESESDDLTKGDFSWALETTDKIKEVEIDIECDMTISNWTPLFIKSVTLGWSC